MSFKALWYIQNTPTNHIFVRSSPNRSKSFPTWTPQRSRFSYVVRIFYFRGEPVRFQLKGPLTPKTSRTARIGQYCTKSLGLFIVVFTKIIPNFLSIQNNLYRQGTVRFQFNEGPASHTTQFLHRASSFDGDQRKRAPTKSMTCSHYFWTPEFGYQAHNTGQWLLFSINPSEW